MALAQGTIPYVKVLFMKINLKKSTCIYDYGNTVKPGARIVTTMRLAKGAVFKTSNSVRNTEQYLYHAYGDLILLILYNFYEVVENGKALYY